MADIVLYVAATDSDATSGATELERVGTRLSVVPAVELETIRERAPAADCVVFAETPTTTDGAHLLDVIDACGSTPLVLYTEAEYGPTTARATDGIAGYVRRDGERAMVHLADEIHWVCHEPEPGTSQEPIAIGPADAGTDDGDTQATATDDGTDGRSSDGTASAGSDSEPAEGNETASAGSEDRDAAVSPTTARRNQAARQDRLEQINRLVDHDIQNQLNLAKGYLAIAAETTDPDYFRDVESAHERLDAALDSLSELSTEPDVLTTIEPVGLQDVARRAWARLDGSERSDRTLAFDGDRLFEADKQRATDAFEALFRGITPETNRTADTAKTDGGESTTIHVETCPDGFVVSAADDPQATEPPADRLGERVERIADAHGWSISIGDSDDSTRVEFTGVGSDETGLLPTLPLDLTIDPDEEW